MTRRLLAATTLVVACAGFSAALVVPASAGTPEGGYICIGTTDRRTPGYLDGVCLK
jgi:hypothetical protein